MPTRNISLTPQLDAYVAKRVASGAYQNASEVTRAALRSLQDRERQDALRLKALRAEIQLGLDDIKAGRYTEIRNERELQEFVANRGRRKPVQKPRGR